MNQKNFVSLVFVVVVLILIVGAGYFVVQNNSNKQALQSAQNTESNLDLPTTCKDEEEGTPIITSLSSYSGAVGTKLEINGCNFTGFEGDKNAWIENANSVKGILYGEEGSTSKNIKITLESSLCQKDTSYSGLSCDAKLDLTSGVYKIYVAPWGWEKGSNKVIFTIK
ncbi:hypothetical protein IT399_00105 [Candidatus Nomurabacteria bacterium]|nr:hypothetical protein [Candidatus Nomurabacteria bacterium]